MQKQTLMMVAVTLVGFSALAAPTQVAIKCVSNPQVFRPQFEGTTTLTVNDDNSVSGTIAFSTRINVNEAFKALSPVALTGTFTDFPAGEMYANEVKSFSLTNGSAPYTTASLNVGTHNAFTSRLMIDGVVTYVSDCEVQP